MRGVFTRTAVVAELCCSSFRVSPRATVGFHSQHAVDQRTAGKKSDRYKYRHDAMFLNGEVSRDAAVPFLTNFW